MKKEEEAYNKSIKDYVDKVVSPIFNKVLQEDISTSMATTPPYKSNGFSYLFRANNYRRQILVKEKTNSTLQEIRGTIGKLPMELNINPHTKIISIKNFKPNITIQYGKNTLTAIYSCPLIHGNKETRLIERNTIDGINARIDEIKENIKKRLNDSLKEFSRRFDLSLPFKKPIWVRHENWIKGDDFIDKIPRETIIHDTIGKKVYAAGWEFIGGKDKEPTAAIKNYIKNRAIEDIAPSISTSLNQLCLRFDNMGNRIIDMMNNRIQVDNELAINIKTHNKVFKKLDNLLSQKDLRKWM